MIAPELQKILDNTEHPLAKAMLQHLFENDEFKENMIKRLKHLLAEQRAKVGYDMQAGEAGVWLWDDEALEEGLGSAFMGLVRTAAVHTAARGLGTSPSTINNFTKHLTNRPKKYAAPQKAGVKPVHTRPAAGSLHTSPIHHMVLPSDVHSKIGQHPGPHEQHLNDFINSHNKLITAKEKNDHSAAVVHYRARNHALVRYQSTAPDTHLKHLNGKKIKQIMSIKP